MKHVIFQHFLFWLRWSGRDLRDRWLLVAAIAATIAIGTGAYASLESLSAWRKDSNAQSLALLRAHDVRLYLADGSFATPAAAAGSRGRHSARRQRRWSRGSAWCCPPASTPRPPAGRSWSPAGWSEWRRATPRSTPCRFGMDAA